jgi:hypothetical protein
MSSIVTSRSERWTNERQQLDTVNEQLDNAHLFHGEQLVDRVRQLIAHDKHVATTHQDMNNKYQALLLQTNMLTNVIKQHSNDVAHHRTNEEQLKEFNEQLLNENQTIKLEMQEYRSKLLQMTANNNEYEHEFHVMRQQTRDLQIQYESGKAEQQILINVMFEALTTMCVRAHG